MRRSSVGLAVLSGLAGVLVVFACSAWGKRLPPPEVKPLVVGETQYAPVSQPLMDVDKRTGMLAFLEARGVRTGKPLWKVAIYEIRYDLNMETDVQDVFVAAIELLGADVLVRTERGQEFMVNPKDKTVRGLIRLKPQAQGG